MEPEKNKKTERIQIWVEPKKKQALVEKAASRRMTLSDYLLKCEENQPPMPEFVWQSDDLNEAIESLVQISDNVKRVTDGVSMTNTVTGKDVAKLEAQCQELNELYAALLMQYTEQRKKITKTARRLVREWKSAERQ